MGTTIKKYTGFFASQASILSARLYSSRVVTDTPEFKDINGNIYGASSTGGYKSLVVDGRSFIDAMKANFSPFSIENAVSYSGTYFDTDYSAVDVANTSLVSCTYTNNKYYYTVSITATSDVTITAIKFTKRLYHTNNGTESIAVTCLMFGAFFDEPIYLQNGETKTVELVVE